MSKFYSEHMSYKDYETQILQSSADFVILKGASGTGKTSILKNLSLSHRDEYFFLDNSVNLFYGTLRENILMGRTECPFLKETIKIVFKSDLELQDLNKVVSDSLVSTGQAQRICLIRDLYDQNKRRVLIDEPTSALDAENERTIIRTLVLWKRIAKIPQFVIATHSEQFEKFLPNSEIISVRKFTGCID